jgi:hypothetical protein
MLSLLVFGHQIMEKTAWRRRLGFKIRLLAAVDADVVYGFEEGKPRGQKGIFSFTIMLTASPMPHDHSQPMS